jgi:hypothetical protein
MSFNICRGTLGSLAMFTIDVGDRLAVAVPHDEAGDGFLDRPSGGFASVTFHRLLHCAFSANEI